MKNKRIKQLTTFGQARKIAQEETTKQYQTIFAECAADVMQQTLANVLLTLERDYGWKRKRLKKFIANLQGWNDIMSQPTELTKTWTTNDNIRYFQEKYSIDLRKVFEAEVAE